jgi:hypothetical protein
MPKKSRITEHLSDDSLGWIALVVGLLAAIVFDRGTPQHNWHPAIVWTVTVFYGAMIFGRSKWNVSQFWIFLTLCFLVHVLAMWVIFSRLIPHWTPGTLLVVPFGFVESILVLVVVARLSRLFGLQW